VIFREPIETLGGSAAGYFDPDQGNWFDRHDVGARQYKLSRYSALLAGGAPTDA
jgi:hypothetical protein